MDQREATTLPPQPVARWLHVDCGWLWVTAGVAGQGTDADVWLGPGDSLALPAGTAWVVQAWPQARATLALQAPAVNASDARPPSALQALVAGWRRLVPPAAWA